MRFRLRTLLIVMTIICAVFSRVAYLKQQRDFHRREAQKLYPQLNEFVTADDLRVSLQYAAEMGRSAGIGQESASAFRRARSTQTDERVHEMWNLWGNARDHHVLAHRYDRAMYRPWVKVWDNPNSVPDDLRIIDWQLGVSVGIAVAFAFGVGWWLDGRRRKTSASINKA